jgi:hypothetical protein
MAMKPALAGAAVLLLGVAATAPAAYAGGTISACGVIITTAGNYTVTTNLTSSSGNKPCIGIAASDVGIDLQGHMITATGAASGGDAITDNFPGGGVSRNVIIANGTIQGFSEAIFFIVGASFVTIEKMNLIENGLGFASFGEYNFVIDSQVNNNQRGMIFNHSHNVVINSQANNNAEVGMAFLGSHNTVVNSQANGNKGGSGIGISGGSDNLVSGDTADDNNIGISVVCPSNLFGNSAHDNTSGDDIVTSVPSGSLSCTRLDNTPAP